MRSPLEKILTLILLPLDGALALLWLLAAVAVGMPARGRNRRRRMIVLAPGSDISSIYQKWGHLNGWLDDNPERTYFENVTRYCMAAPNNCRIRIHQRYDGIEMKIPFGMLRLTHAARIVLAMARQTAAERVAVLHAKDPYVAGFLCWLAGRITGTPVVASLVTDWEQRVKVSPQKIYGLSIGALVRVGRFVLPRLDRSFPVQKKFEQIMLKYGARPEKTRFFPHAHDLSKFSRPYPDPKGALGFADPKRIWITTVGRVHRENFVFDIVPIAKGVVARRSDMQFIVAGDGPHRRELEAAIRAAGLERDIYLVGYLSNDRVPLLRQAGAVSLVLVGGYALREACAAGRPIVSYDVEFHKEFIVNDETGYLIPEGDTGAAVDAILKLLDHPDRAQAMGRRAQEMILARHSYEVVDPMKRKLYDELFSQAPFKIEPDPAG